MTDTERRYMHAKQRIRAELIDPIEDLLESSLALVVEVQRERDDARAVLEQLRPVWAQGHTSDSAAAQATGNALSELWQELGVRNQTAAIKELRALKEMAAR